MFLKLLLIMFIVISLPALSIAGIWESDPSRVFHLDASSFENYKLSEIDEKWVTSLVSNLKAKGSTIVSYYVFVKTNAIFNIGSSEKGTVYVNRNDHDQFITFEKTFFIDFKKAKVDLFVSGPASIHKGPNDKFLVVINPLKGDFGGIPVWSGGVPPKFKEKVVTWH
jgi:hypothetical protein